MIDNGSFVYILTIGIKAKDPPWFADLTGSVADSVAAKVTIKSEKLTPFEGIFSIMELFDSILSSVIDSTAQIL